MTISDVINSDPVYVHSGAPEVRGKLARDLDRLEHRLYDDADDVLHLREHDHMAALHAARDRQPWMRSLDDGRVLVVHEEFITELTLPEQEYTAGQFTPIYDERINAANDNTFPWLSGLARNFEKYRCLRLQFAIVPHVSKLRAGMLAGAVDPDILDAPLANIAEVMIHDGSSAAAIYDYQTFDLPRARELGWFFTDEDAITDGGARLSDVADVQIGVVDPDSELIGTGVASLLVRYAFILERPTLGASGYNPTTVVDDPPYNWPPGIGDIVAPVLIYALAQYVAGSTSALPEPWKPTLSQLEQAFPMNDHGLKIDFDPKRAATGDTFSRGLVQQNEAIGQNAIITVKGAFTDDATVPVDDLIMKLYEGIEAITAGTLLQKAAAGVRLFQRQYAVRFAKGKNAAFDFEVSRSGKPIPVSALDVRTEIAGVTSAGSFLPMMVLSMDPASAMRAGWDYEATEVYAQNQRTTVHRRGRRTRTCVEFDNAQIASDLAALHQARSQSDRKAELAAALNAAARYTS